MSGPACVVLLCAAALVVRHMSWDVGAARCCGYWRVSEYLRHTVQLRQVHHRSVGAVMDL